MPVRTMLLFILVLAWAVPLEAQANESTEVVLRPDCIIRLKDHDERLKGAGAAKALLAWTPFLVIQGESNPVHLAWQSGSMPWEELASSISNVNKLAFSSLAWESQLHAYGHENDRALKKFWLEMRDFYWRAANEGGGN